MKKKTGQFYLYIFIFCFEPVHLLYRYMIAYIRDVALDYRFMAESFETSVPWSKVHVLIPAVKERIAKEARLRHVPGEPLISARVTQTYDTGCCVYFYFGFLFKGLNEPGMGGNLSTVVLVDRCVFENSDHLFCCFSCSLLFLLSSFFFVLCSLFFVLRSLFFVLLAKVFGEIEACARDTIMDFGGSISHHHGIGKHRTKWLETHHGSAALAMMKAMKKSIDPKNTFNTGNLLL